MPQPMFDPVPVDQLLIPSFIHYSSISSTLLKNATIGIKAAAAPGGAAIVVICAQNNESLLQKI